MSVSLSDAKAPFVMFERRAEEDRAASIAAGRYVTKDVDYALITPHGSKDQIERIVGEWIPYLEQQVQEGRFERDWLRAIKSGYADWVEGRETPLEGTPVINWPLLSPSQVRLLQDLKVLTVEKLAAANEELIRRLGMGGRNLVDKAKAFLEQANGPGKVAEEMAALKARLEGLENQNKVLHEQNAALVAGQGQAKGPAHLDASQGNSVIGADDLGLNDPPAALKKL